MATSTKLLVCVPWLLSLFGRSLAGISWSCPANEMVSSDYGCYLFHISPLLFDEAEAYCWSVGTSLLWVQGHEEMVFLAGQALQTPQVTAWLIGLHTTSERKDLATYFWSSGHKVTFTAWSDLEPDHYGNERCVTMELKYGYRWATVSCEERRSFICKSDPPFFRLKNPILLGILGVISILLIILIFVLCTMRHRSSNSCDDQVKYTEGSANKNGANRDALILAHLSQPTAPPVEDRYTSLPHANPCTSNEPLDHIYEDMDGHRRMSRPQDPQGVRTHNPHPQTPPPQSPHPQNPHPTNPYLMWA